MTSNERYYLLLFFIYIFLFLFSVVVLFLFSFLLFVALRASVRACVRVFYFSCLFFFSIQIPVHHVLKD